VAASSEAWGWLFSSIPKASGFEAATQLENGTSRIKKEESR